MLPQDPIMLLSYVNTQLRDYYDSLDDLCSSLDIDKESLEQTLSDAGFVYMVNVNQFK